LLWEQGIKQDFPHHPKAINRIICTKAQGYLLLQKESRDNTFNYIQGHLLCHQDVWDEALL
jgi:hypothetical protein